ncbi:MAG TPA: LysO family transporter [Methanocella sp.]|uniref:LysO family transporter n=1 Tax=Methanocella sp. TaxID=2052833 RepID=UPI002CAC88C9|nr:LysO family transporter [Methanocella sp.]HTY91918.1 LysO family transporter [Methanocella sp.]
MDGMVTYIGLLFISLIVGVAAGLLKGRFSGRLKKYVSSAITCMVFVLILLMGLKTGSNEAVINNLGLYGLQSLLITVCAILGSIVFAMLFERLFFKDGTG